jgi:queuosine precursor transporter
MKNIYHFVSAAFCLLVLFSNIISVKLVQLPLIDLVIPAGLLTYPLTFLLSDFVTEMFGAKKARLMVYIALAMNLFGLCILQFALMLPSQNHEIDSAFQLILGLSGLRIFSSLLAYLISQIVDVQLYAFIKRITGNRFLWLRNNGSTWISQAVDTLVIDLIYLCGGLKMGFVAVLPIMLFSYTYKAFFSVGTTPFLYLLVYMTKKIKPQVA